MPFEKVHLTRYVQNDFAVALKKYVIDRRQWVMYKTVPDWQFKEFEKVLVTEPDKKFTDFVVKTVNDYVFKEIAPPTAIAPAIQNMADDFLHGRDPVLRSGDYIAIKTYLKTK